MPSRQHGRHRERPPPTHHRLGLCAVAGCKVTIATAQCSALLGGLHRLTEQMYVPWLGPRTRTSCALRFATFRLHRCACAVTRKHHYLLSGRKTRTHVSVRGRLVRTHNRARVTARVRTSQASPPQISSSPWRGMALDGDATTAAARVDATVLPALALCVPQMRRRPELRLPAAPPSSPSQARRGPALMHRRAAVPPSPPAPSSCSCTWSARQRHERAVGASHAQMGGVRLRTDTPRRGRRRLKRRLTRSLRVGAPAARACARAPDAMRSGRRRHIAPRVHHRGAPQRQCGMLRRGGLSRLRTPATPR